MDPLDTAKYQILLLFLLGGAGGLAAAGAVLDRNGNPHHSR